MKPMLISNYRAQGALEAHRIAAAGSDEQTVTQAVNGTNALLGVTTEVGADNGSRIDVIHSGIADVDFGASVAYGEALTSDADGKAVPASSGDRLIGIAMCGGLKNDRGAVLIGLGAVHSEPLEPDATSPDSNDPDQNDPEATDPEQNDPDSTDPDPVDP